MLILTYSVKLGKDKERKWDTSFSHLDMTSHRFAIITASLRFFWLVLKYLKDFVNVK